MRDKEKGGQVNLPLSYTRASSIQNFGSARRASARQVLFRETRGDGVESSMCEEIKC